jgi:7-carboxy-7-deazaguanine synthase
LAGEAGHDMSVEEIAELASAHHRVVITGGEPLAQDIAPLVSALRGRHITVETSGTIFADLPAVSLFSLSPKVGSSGYTPKPAVLRKYFATAAGRMQVKFVIADANDVQLAFALLEELADALPPATPIVLQPESGRAGSGDDYVRFLEWLTSVVLGDPAWRAYDVRVLPQLHYLLWKGVPGR